MNLEDVIDPDYGLQQDEWSLSKPTFGDEGQLQVVGWSGRIESQSAAKFYILKCHKCSLDTELFSEGYFKSTKSNITKSQLPCGCSRIPKWTKDQHYIRCLRKACELGYDFLGFSGDWKKQYTQLRMQCRDHGVWTTATVTSLLNSGKGCPTCAVETRRLGKLKDSSMIASFFASGAFHPDTKFWRSDRKTTQGISAYWKMYCPECEEEGESFCANLQKGFRSCGCSLSRQQEAYINFVIDGDIKLAVKFGIATVSSRRLSQQNYSCVHSLVNHSVFTFPDAYSCKAAERECKQTLDCGIISKCDMPDGYTETTYLYNIDKITEIYKRHGGVEICR